MQGAAPAFKFIDKSSRLKKIILLLLIVLCTTYLKAQSGFNFAPYGFQAEASSVHAFDDFKKNFNNKAFSILGVYNYSPYLPIAAELQFGQLSGGSNSNKAIDPYGRQSTNSYKAFLLHADIEAGELIDYGDNFILNILKNFYIGTGIGLISNHMDFVQRADPYNPGYTFPGQNSSIEFILPLRFGYEIKFYNAYDEPAFAINLGYRHNITFAEGLDGYNDPTLKFKNNAPDQYRQITFGVKINFGYVQAYNKNIRRGF